MNAHGDERFHAAMASPTRRSVLAVVADAADAVDAHTIAGHLDLHVTTVRFHLEQLEAVRLVSRVSPGEKRRGRPRVLYVAAREGGGGAARDTAKAQRDMDAAGLGDAAEERSRAQLIEVLAAALAEQAERDGDRGRGAAIAAGRAWGRAAGAGEIAEGGRTTALLHTLDELGFAPEHRGSDVHLHGCPFRDAAREHPQVVCAAHLGLIRELMNDHIDAVELLPMVQPALCVVTLPQRQPANARGAE